MEVGAVSGKGKGKEKSGKGKKGGKKGKKATQAKISEKRQQNTHDSTENLETGESMDRNHLIVGTRRRTNLKVKARAWESRNPR